MGIHANDFLINPCGEHGMNFLKTKYGQQLKKLHRLFFSDLNEGS